MPTATSGASVAAIEALYKTRVSAFVRFATAMLHDAELARDVVQDAFAKALRQRGRFREEGSIEAWMWSTVVNTARNASRARGVRARVKPFYEDPFTSPFADELDGDRRLVRELVAALPERQRLCVFLRYFADLDYATIATTLGVRQGTVAASLNAARKTLRDGLEAVR